MSQSNSLHEGPSRSLSALNQSSQHERHPKESETGGTFEGGNPNLVPNPEKIKSLSKRGSSARNTLPSNCTTTVNQVPGPRNVGTNNSIKNFTKNFRQAGGGSLMNSPRGSLVPFSTPRGYSSTGQQQPFPQQPQAEGSQNPSMVAGPGPGFCLQLTTFFFQNLGGKSKKKLLLPPQF